MAISTTAFGIYFNLMATIHNPTSLNLMMQQTSEEPADLTWLALASMAVFISGEISKFLFISQIEHCKSQYRMRKSIFERCYGILSTLNNNPFPQQAESTKKKKEVVFRIKRIISHEQYCFCVQVLLLVGVQSHGWSCQRFSLSKWGELPVLCASSPTGAWHLLSPKPFKIWWWVPFKALGAFLSCVYIQHNYCGQKHPW